MVAVPDFAAGAMENWGLVTYREQSLLFDMDRDRFSRKSYVCTTVSHEMAHMWFGDYVTCDWWDELWLNEAFATYFAWVGVEPSDETSLKWKDDTGVATWDLDHDLITKRMTAALNADQTVSSNPIINIENRIGFNHLNQRSPDLTRGLRDLGAIIGIPAWNFQVIGCWITLKKW